MIVFDVAVASIADGDRPGRVGADVVPLDQVPVVARHPDAAKISGDHVTGAGGGAADRVAGRFTGSKLVERDAPVGGAGQGLAVGIEADVVPRDQVVVRREAGVTRDQDLNSIEVVARSIVAGDDVAGPRDRAADGIGRREEQDSEALPSAASPVTSVPM